MFDRNNKLTNALSSDMPGEQKAARCGRCARTKWLIWAGCRVGHYGAVPLGVAVGLACKPSSVD